jgi:WD40 repeat protein
VEALDALTGKRQALFACTSPVACVAVTGLVDRGVPRVLIAGGDDSVVRTWDMDSGAEVGPVLTGHAQRVTCLAFSAADDPGGCLLASGSADGTIRCWHVGSRSLLWVVRSRRQRLDTVGVNVRGVEGLGQPQLTLITYYSSTSGTAAEVQPEPEDT